VLVYEMTQWFAICSTRSEMCMYKFVHRHFYAKQWCSLSSSAVFLFLWYIVCG
jgi:hypothetical protein